MEDKIKKLEASLHALMKKNKTKTDSSLTHIENKLLKKMEVLEKSVKTLELENAKLKEEVTYLKEEIATSKELREDGKIQETDKLAIKEEITKELTKAMEVKMEATKEGWVDVVSNKIKKKVKEEKQHEETLWMHATLKEKKMREARMLNVRVSGIKEEHGASSESDGRELCAKLGDTNTPFTKAWRVKRGCSCYNSKTLWTKSLSSRRELH
ncbi:hypothetical protein L7F22_003452 [Adiantum nelumboides]|nr:hypothetical protein [Adiantum nelumboides]